MISTHYARVVSIFLGLALLPTILHTYLGFTETDGLVTSAISHSLTGLSAEPISSSSRSLEKTFESVDLINRRYNQVGGGGLRLFVARSYNHKRLYHHPEIHGRLRGLDLDDLGTKRISGEPDIPIHLLKSSNASNHDVIVYSLLYDNQFIDDPFQFLIRTAWSSLFQGRKPMTLFFVHNPAALPNIPLSESRAVRLLLEAIHDFRSQQPFPPASDL